jgi:ubiquitin carboxyl-terminal hydrolase L5
VVYTNVGGTLVELDGLKRDAVNHGEIDEGSGGGWIEKALGVIQRRIEMYPAGSVSFSPSLSTSLLLSRC